MNSDIFRRLKAVPPIVRIIITQASRRRAASGMTEAVFEEQMCRLTREELKPKGLTLLIRDLEGGRTRFIIKEEATGAVCDMMEFTADGALDAESAQVFARVAPERSFSCD